MLKMMVESLFQCLTTPSFQQNPLHPISGGPHSQHSATAQHGALVAQQLTVGDLCDFAFAPFLWQRYRLPAGPACSRGLLFQPPMNNLVWPLLLPCGGLYEQDQHFSKHLQRDNLIITCPLRSPAPSRFHALCPFLGTRPGPLPEVGVMGAAARPFMFRAAICCIWAAAKAAMGFRYPPCATEAMIAACCCISWNKREQGKNITQSPAEQPGSPAPGWRPQAKPWGISPLWDASLVCLW